MDDPLTYEVGPFWAMPCAEDGEVLVFDENGFNHFSQPATGCGPVTFQGFGNPGETATSDSTREMLLRTFMPGKNTLYVKVACPTTEIWGADELFEGLGMTEFSLVKHELKRPRTCLSSVALRPVRC